MSIARMRRHDLAEPSHRPLTITPDMLHLTPVPCQRCRSPQPTFVLVIPKPHPEFRGLDWSRAEAYRRHSNVGGNMDRCCRNCTWLAAVTRLCGGLQRERIVSPERTDLEKLQAEIRALRGEKPPKPEKVPADALVDVGTVYTAPSMGDHSRPRQKSPGQWAAFLQGIVEQHRLGRFGLHGNMPIEVLAESRELGPLASISQANAISILDGTGSVRSEFDRRPDLASHYAHNPKADTIRVWTELGLGTLVYRPGDCIEVDT